MTIQELMQEHVKEKCKYCNKKECDGIHITQEGKTVCEVTEDEVFRNK